MASEPDFLENVRTELSSFRVWLDRALILGYAGLAGLAVVAFTYLSEWTFAQFERAHAVHPAIGLVVTPLLAAGIVWLTRRWFPGAAGSGIPQVMATLDPALPPQHASRFVSLRLTFAKIGLSSLGLLGGMSIGREGPSVQVAAGVMQHAGRWLRPESGISRHALMVAGGAGGIAAAFNAPLAGVVFAIEDLARDLGSRNSGLIIAAIVLGGLVGASFFGNITYFGVIRVPGLGWHALLPGLMVAVTCGLAGGLFARLLIASLTGAPDRFNRWRARYPVRFAAAAGLGVAVVGLAAGGSTYGAGSEAVKQMLAGQSDVPTLYPLLKLVATWLTAWSGVPGGIFAPSLSIGAGIGNDIARFATPELAPVLIAMGMAAFLGAVTQAPLTAFIIVMEMVDGHAMVLSLMAVTLLASGIARLVSRSLYSTLSDFMVASVLGPAPAATPSPPPPPEVQPVPGPASRV